VLCSYHSYVRESRGGCVHFLWLRDTNETGLCFVASETKAAHPKSGSVIVSLSAIAVSHRPAYSVTGKTVSKVKRPNRVSSTE